METTLTPTEDQSGITTKQWRNFPEQTTEYQWERSLKTLERQKNQLQHNLSTPAQQNTKRGGGSDSQLTSWQEGPAKERPNNNQNPKTTESQHKWQSKTSKLRR